LASVYVTMIKVLGIFAGAGVAGLALASVAPKPSRVPVAVAAAPAVRWDTTQLRAQLARMGIDLERVLVQRGVYHAAVIRRPEPDGIASRTVTTMPDQQRHELRWDGKQYLWDGTPLFSPRGLDSIPLGQFPEDVNQDGIGRVRELMMLRVEKDSIRPIAPGEVIGRFTPKRAEWLADEAVGMLFTYTLDDVIEGAVMTRVFEIRGDRASVIYSDPENACVPATLRDIDADGRSELIVPTGRLACGTDAALCREQLDSLSAPAGWPDVYRRISGKWELARTGVSAFYAQVAREFERAAKATPRPACATGFIPDTLVGWAARARALTRP
jgi:hypothetical protein